MRIEVYESTETAQTSKISTLLLPRDFKLTTFVEACAILTTLSGSAMKKGLVEGSAAEKIGSCNKTLGARYANTVLAQCTEDQHLLAIGHSL